MYGFLQTGKMEAFRKAVFRAGLTHLYDAAYPSGELASLVNTALRDGTCTFSTLYSQFMLVEQYEFPGIFLVSDSDPREDNARAIYVGYSAKSISFNIWSYPGQIPFRRGKGTPLPSPFTEYARAQADVSHSWIVTIFPQDLCLRMAIAGHIIPGFERDRNATENCLRKRYEDAELMLVHAQEALTALVRPSLNTNGMYPRELLEERKNGTK